MNENLDEIRVILKKYGQEHLLNGYDKLEDKKKKGLGSELKYLWKFCLQTF